MLTDKYLLLSESFARDYASRLEHYTNPANAGKLDDFIREHYEQKITASKDIYQFDGKNAHITISGPMSPTGPDLYDIFYGWGGVSYVDILNAIEQAKDDVDPKNGELFFHADTPGGTVSMVDDVYMAIRDCGLKTTMYNTGMLCSGGMWIAAACNKIVATSPVAFTGSIGVIVSCLDPTGLYEKMGLKKVVITNHEASEKAPDISTEEGQAVIREELNAIYGVFKTRVIQGRKGKISEIEIDHLKGGVKVAYEAMAAGLIDEVLGSGRMPLSRKSNKRAQAKPSPADKGAKDMTLEQMRAEHPELVAAIEAEARAGMHTAEELDSARSEGAAAENQRINDVRAQLIPGHEALIEQLAADGKTTGAQAAMAIIAAEKSQRIAAAAAIDEEAPAPVPAVAAEAATGKTIKRKDFDALSQDKRRAFLADGGKITD